MARPAEARRNADGSIDMRFYRRRASRLRAIARRRAAQRIRATLVAVREYLSTPGAFREPPVLRERPSGS